MKKFKWWLFYVLLFTLASIYFAHENMLEIIREAGVIKGIIGIIIIIIVASSVLLFTPILLIAGLASGEDRKNRIAAYNFRNYWADKR